MLYQLEVSQEENNAARLQMSRVRVSWRPAKIRHEREKSELARRADDCPYTALRWLRETISANPRTSRLAPPTSAPSTSGRTIRSWMLSGLTLPP